MTLEMVVNSVIAGSAYALVAVGFSCIYSAARSFHLAHAAIYTIAAYIFCVGIGEARLSPWIVVPLSIFGACLVGVVVEIWVYRPLRHAGSSPLVMLVASLGVLVLLQNGISLLFGDTSRAVSTGCFGQTFSVLGMSITLVRLGLVVVSGGVFLAMWILVRFSIFGKKMRAVACDAELAQIVGIKPDNIILKVMILGSATAAIAAIFQACDTSIFPLMGFDILMMSIVATIVGGIGSIGGAALGGLLVGFAQNVGIWILPSQWQDTIVFGMLVAFLLIRPQGFLGRPVLNRPT